MNTPFKIVFSVRQINHHDNTTGILPQETYPINVTLKHNINDIKHSIWVNSPDFALKPIFTKVIYEGNPVTESQTLHDLLQTPEVPQYPVTDKFELLIDYTLFNSPIIPQRDPVVELFDTIILWKDDKSIEHTIRRRESLGCTVGTVKEYVLENYNKATKDSIRLQINSGDEFYENDDLNLSQILKLDVPPKVPVTIKATILPDTIQNSAFPPPQATKRFHVLIESNVPRLQEENSMFEVNKFTTVRELKAQIQEKIDFLSVTRTFEEQIKLSYQGTPIVQSDTTILHALGLDYETLNQPVRIKLEISESLSGNNGILSRDFLNDLAASDRLQFYPSSAPPRATGSQNTPHESQGILPIEPTRIVIEDGVEWNLTGESYERIRPTSDTSVDGSPRELLVDQSDLSTLDYEFTLKIGDAIKTVVLNTSQCIIVDKGNHSPYLLLSPSGAAKLYRTFRLPNGDPLIQQVQVMMYNEASSSTYQRTPTPTQTSPITGQAAATSPTNNHNTHLRPSEGGMALLFRIINQLFGRHEAVGTRAILFILKGLVIVNILGIHIPVQLWKPVLLYGLLISQVYVLFFAGGEVAARIEEQLNINNDVNIPQTRPFIARAALGLAKVLRFTSGATTGLAVSIKNELITVAVSRTRDYDLILDDQGASVTSRWWNNISEGAYNAWKDILLCGLTIVPSVDSRIQEELEKRKSTEMEELQQKVRLFVDLIQTLTERYNEQYTPAFELPEALNYERMRIVLESEVQENQNSEGEGTEENNNENRDEIQDDENNNGEENNNENTRENESELYELRFRLLIDYYRELQKVYESLNTAIITSTPMANGRRIEETPDAGATATATTTATAP